VVFNKLSFRRNVEIPGNSKLNALEKKRVGAGRAGRIKKVEKSYQQQHTTTRFTEASLPYWYCYR
jgi:hypothetical protein